MTQHLTEGHEMKGGHNPPPANAKRPPPIQPGDRFGNLIVVARVPGSKKTFRCRCKCGREIAALSGSIRSGRVDACQTCMHQKYAVRRKQAEHEARLPDIHAAASQLIATKNLATIKQMFQKCESEFEKSKHALGSGEFMSDRKKQQKALCREMQILRLAISIAPAHTFGTAPTVEPLATGAPVFEGNDDWRDDDDRTRGR